MTEEKNETNRPFWFVPYSTEREPTYIPFDDVARHVGPGWKDILSDLTTKLFKLGWDGGLLQVKEKFGGLRFYWQNNIQDTTLASIADNVVEVAEWRSTQTCEECGKYGTSSSGKGYWIKTLCEEHTKERDEKHERIHAVS